MFLAVNYFFFINVSLCKLYLLLWVKIHKTRAEIVESDCDAFTVYIANHFKSHLCQIFLAEKQLGFEDMYIQLEATCLLLHNFPPPYRL